LGCHVGTLGAGRHGTYGTGMVLVARFGLGGSVGVCVAWDIQGVAGVALTALGLLWWRGWGWRALQDFAWHVWHLMTLTLLLCGRQPGPARLQTHTSSTS